MRLEFGRNIRLFSESLDFINLLAQRARQKIIFKSNELLIFFLNIYISHTYLSLSLNHFYSLDISLSLSISLSCSLILLLFFLTYPNPLSYFSLSLSLYYDISFLSYIFFYNLWHTFKFYATAPPGWSRKKKQPKVKLILILVLFFLEGDGA